MLLSRFAQITITYLNYYGRLTTWPSFGSFNQMIKITKMKIRKPLVADFGMRILFNYYPD